MSARIKSRVRWFNSKGPESAGTGVSEGWIVRQDGEMREKIMPAAQLPLRGPHNLENALAACEAAREAGVDAASLADGLKSFAGVEHRLEPAGSIGQVVFINDSKATNVEAMEKALQSFPERVVLIAGGRDKNLDFRSARELAAERVKQAILIGEAAEKIAASWQGAVPLSKAETLEEAVGRAYEVTRPRGTVLLSPGCASFDMFLNFEDRGRKFRTAVSKLAASVTHGERVAQ